MQALKNLLRHTLPALLLCLVTTLTLTGCSQKGKLNEGDCKGIISFTDIPKEFSMLEKNLQENFAIHVTLKNIVNEKEYTIRLTQENDFKQEVFLNPGTYQVYSVYASQASNTGISVSADAEKMTFTRDDLATLHVYVDNQEEFTQHWMAVQPMPEMLLADTFDGLIQINRQVIDLRAEDPSQLIAQLDISYDQPVPAYKEVTLTDSALGVSIILLNDDGQPADWRDCKLVGIYVFRNNVVFPQGVTLGMAPEDICHGDKGLYGEPDSFTGSLLYGWNFDDTYAIYRDPESGDKMTICLGSDSSGIRNIRYELEQFED